MASKTQSDCADSIVRALFNWVHKDKTLNSFYILDLNVVHDARGQLPLGLV